MKFRLHEYLTPEEEKEFEQKIGDVADGIYLEVQDFIDQLTDDYACYDEDGWNKYVYIDDFKSIADNIKKELPSYLNNDEDFIEIISRRMIDNLNANYESADDCKLFEDEEVVGISPKDAAGIILSGIDDEIFEYLYENELQVDLDDVEILDEELTHEEYIELNKEADEIFNPIYEFISSTLKKYTKHQNYNEYIYTRDFAEIRNVIQDGLKLLVKNSELLKEITHTILTNIDYEIDQQKGAEAIKLDDLHWAAMFNPTDVSNLIFDWLEENSKFVAMGDDIEFLDESKLDTQHLYKNDWLRLVNSLEQAISNSCNNYTYFKTSKNGFRDLYIAVGNLVDIYQDICLDLESNPVFKEEVDLLESLKIFIKGNIQTMLDNYNNAELRFLDVVSHIRSNGMTDTSDLVDEYLYNQYYDNNVPLEDIDMLDEKLKLQEDVDEELYEVDIDEELYNNLFTAAYDSFMYYKGSYSTYMCSDDLYKALNKIKNRQYVKALPSYLYNMFLDGLKDGIESLEKHYGKVGIPVHSIEEMVLDICDSVIEEEDNDKQVTLDFDTDILEEKLEAVTNEEICKQLEEIAYTELFRYVGTYTTYVHDLNDGLYRVKNDWTLKYFLKRDVDTYLTALEQGINSLKSQYGNAVPIKAVENMISDACGRVLDNMGTSSIKLGDDILTLDESINTKGELLFCFGDTKETKDEILKMYKNKIAPENGFYTKEEWDSFPCVDNQYGYLMWDDMYFEAPEEFCYSNLITEDHIKYLNRFKEPIREPSVPSNFNEVYEKVFPSVRLDDGIDIIEEKFRLAEDWEEVDSQEKLELLQQILKDNVLPLSDKLCVEWIATYPEIAIPLSTCSSDKYIELLKNDGWKLLQDDPCYMFEKPPYQILLFPTGFNTYVSFYKIDSSYYKQVPIEADFLDEAKRDDVLKNVPEENKGGDCYVRAMHYVQSHPNATLVHGIVTGQGKIAGLEYNHAWAEEDGNVIDKTVNLVLPQEIYYALGNIKITRKYSYKEMIDNVLKYETYGPWDDELWMYP